MAVVNLWLRNMCKHVIRRRGIVSFVVGAIEQAKPDLVIYWLFSDTFIRSLFFFFSCPESRQAGRQKQKGADASMQTFKIQLRHHINMLP